MRLVQIFIFILLAISSYRTYCGEHEIHVYFSYFVHPDIALISNEEIPFVINQKRKIVYSGDAVYPAEFCDADSEYLCVNSAIFDFSVPKDIEDKDQWTINGKKYRVIRRADHRMILGERIDIYVIELREDGLSKQFLFSETRGLLAYQVRSLEDGNAGWSVWSKSTKGFGAN